MIKKAIIIGIIREATSVKNKGVCPPGMRWCNKRGRCVKG